MNELKEPVLINPFSIINNIGIEIAKVLYNNKNRDKSGTFAT